MRRLSRAEMSPGVALGLAAAPLCFFLCTIILELCSTRAFEDVPSGYWMSLRGPHTSLARSKIIQRGTAEAVMLDEPRRCSSAFRVSLPFSLSVTPFYVPHYIYRTLSTTILFLDKAHTLKRAVLVTLPSSSRLVPPAIPLLPLLRLLRPVPHRISPPARHGIHGPQAHGGPAHQPSCGELPPQPPRRAPAHCEQHVEPAPGSCDAGAVELEAGNVEVAGEGQEWDECHGKGLEGTCMQGGYQGRQAHAWERGYWVEDVSDQLDWRRCGE